MGRTLEFALSTLIITTISAISALVIANRVGAMITELFNQIIEAFPH